MNLYTKESGTGQPMVLLHGNGEDSSYFVNQMSFFESKYHVIAVDTRGHGRSPRGRGIFTLERFADDLKGFLDRRGLRRIILLGRRQYCADFCTEISGICRSADFKWSELKPVWHEAVRAGGCGAGVCGSCGEALAAEKRHRADAGKNADGSGKNADRKAIFKRKRKTEWTGRTE